MRRLATALAVLLAAAAVAVTVAASWTALRVSDDDGFVTLVQSVTDDEQTRTLLARMVAERLGDSTDLPPAAEPAVERAALAAADRVFADDDFVTAWEDSLRATHARAFDGTGSRRLVVDLTPLAALVAERTDGVVDPPRSVTTSLATDMPGEAVRVVQAAPRVALLGAVAVVVTAGAALLLARRRSTVTAALGAAVIVGAGLALVPVAALVLPLQDVVDAADEGDVSGQSALVESISDVVLGSFGTWALVTAIGGAALLVVGASARIVAGRRSSASG